MATLDRFEPPENYESLLAAVRETNRGRWFLDEYRARIQRSGTESILTAIGRVEAAIASLPVSEMPVLNTARAAIANARREIAGLPGDGPDATAGAFFAHLAQGTAANNNSGEEAPALSRRIARALQLVDELDAAIGSSARTDLAPPLKPAQMRYFSQDEDVFVAPAKTQQPLASPPEAKLEKTEAQRGARLVIKRRDEEQANVMSAAEAAPAPVETSELRAPECFNEMPADVFEPAAPVIPAPQAEDTSPQPPVQASALPEAATIAAPANAPIVIIRRPAGEVIDIPFIDELANENAA